MIRHGSAPFLECSTAGDRRFSAFVARVRGRGGRSIEELYQGAKVFADGTTGLAPRDAKGRRPINVDAMRALYATLWDEWGAENPDLVDVLVAATGLADRYGQPGHACQATELWRIRCARLGDASDASPALAPKAQLSLF